MTCKALLDDKYSKIRLKLPLSKMKNWFQDQLSLNGGQKYCRMLKVEHSAKLSTSIKLPFVIKIFILSFFEWPFYTGYCCCQEILAALIKGVCMMGGTYGRKHYFHKHQGSYYIYDKHMPVLLRLLDLIDVELFILLY